MEQGFDRRALLGGAIMAGGVALAVPAAAQQPAAPKLSTHALDMHSGRQAAGIRIDFSRRVGDRWELVKTVRADHEGRVHDQLLDAKTMAVGQYELMFHVGQYYRDRGVTLTDPPFLDEVPLRIAIYDATKSYHVPLYFSPWGILSYRGS